MSGMIVTSAALVAGLCGGIAAGNFFLLRNYQKKKAQRRAKIFERQKQKQLSEGQGRTVDKGKNKEANTYDDN